MILVLTMTRQELIESIGEVASLLPSIYPHRNFEDHCYLRMAYDQAVGYKWDTLIPRPFIYNATKEQLERSYRALRLMCDKESTVDIFNDQSLKHRT